jgi:hypothetical protein
MNRSGVRLRSEKKRLRNVVIGKNSGGWRSVASLV